MKKRYVIQRFPDHIVRQLDELKGAFNSKSRPEVLEELLRLHGQGGRSAIGRTADFEGLLKDPNPQPQCLNSLPGGGKSYTLEQFLRKCLAPSVVFDPGQNQAWIPDIVEYRDFQKFEWPKEGGFRVTFSADAGYRRQDFSRVLEDLQRAIATGLTDPYVICFEDAFEFREMPEFLSLLATLRKHARLVIVVSQAFEPFAPFTIPVSPLPWRRS